MPLHTDRALLPVHDSPVRVPDDGSDPSTNSGSPVLVPAGDLELFALAPSGDHELFALVPAGVHESPALVPVSTVVASTNTGSSGPREVT